MPCSNSRYCIRVIVDVILLFIVVSAIFAVKKLWPPFDRGMYCADESLTYPLKDRDTVSDSLLLFYGVAIPVSVMCLVEFIRTRKEAVGKELSRKVGRKLSSWLWTVYASVGAFLFGCACTQLATDMTKYSLGCLRPHFIAVCKPDWTLTNCSTNSLRYVDPIPCTTDDLDTLRDARLSFPSGHASFSTFTMLYLVVYLQARLTISGSRLVKPVLQLVCLLLNLYTCLTRLSDYKHHWADVFGGAALGATVAVLVVVFVSDLLPKKCSSVAKSTALMLQDYHQTPEEPPHNNAHSSP